jgi:alpha-L-rhamnosidase
MKRFLVASILTVFCCGAVASAQTVAELRRGFEHPPDDARIMMRWWWFGPTVQKPELEREMRAMKQGGIGGFEVQPVYPLEVDGNFPYLSPEFLDDLRFTGERAKELGLRFDLTLASGWPYGGPHIPLDKASGRLRVVKDKPPTLAEGEKLIGQAEAGGATYYFVQSHTRQAVKRPAVGAEGLVLDHYDPAAIALHLQTVADKLLAAVSKTPPYAVFSDSLEVYGADWTPNLLDEFRKRRGYDLMPHLAALAADIGPQTGAIRHDWGKTLSELADSNYLTPIRNWAQAHGSRFRSQTYGIPPVTLSSNALVDLPEGEGSQWRAFSATRWAASASHLYGRPVTSSETWTWLHSPVFRAAPLDMKAEADIHFLQGINQLIGHGWPYSPPEAGEPGWRFYAAAVFNNHNPWWIAMPDITLYLQRMSWLLRQGQPANDVAVYLPTDDAFASFQPGRPPSVNQAMDRLIGRTVIPQILDSGYNFDFIDDAAIAKVGVPYKILVLPGVERMPLATLQKTLATGATVIATRHAPSLAPGLMDEADTPKIQELAAKLKVVADETKLGDALHAALPADVLAPPEIGFIHRHLPDSEVYFVVNTSNHPVPAPSHIRVTAMNAAQWNPQTGAITAVDQSDFAPYESRVVVFSKSTSPAAAPHTAGTKLVVNMRRLTDPDRFFSGTIPYEAEVNLTDAPPRGAVLNFGEGSPVTTDDRRSGAGMRAMMDGPVREAAVVYVNGKRAGAVWCAPWEIDLTGLLHTGKNTIRVEVGNSALNVMAKGPLPDYKALTAKYGERFQAQEMNLVVPQPSGLLGQVRLIIR